MEGNETVDIEVEAKAMGWAPKEEWRGAEEKWIDAETYVERGKQILPIVKANNRKLEQENQALKSEVSQIKQLLQASAESIEELKNFNSLVARDKAKERQGELKEAIKEAREAEDVDLEMQLTDQLAETRQAIKEAEKTKDTRPPTRQAASDTTDYTQAPEWKEWHGENPWFGQDKYKTAVAMAEADAIRADPARRGLRGKAFLNAIAAEVEKAFPNTRRQGPSKMDQNGSGGGDDAGSGGGSGRGGKTMADVPAEDKAVYQRQIPKMVGPGRAFKTEAEWRTHFLTQYFKE